MRPGLQIREDAEELALGAELLQGGIGGDEAGLVEGDHGGGELLEDGGAGARGDGRDGLEDDMDILGGAAEGGEFHHGEEALQGRAESSELIAEGERQCHFILCFPL